MIELPRQLINCATLLYLMYMARLLRKRFVAFTCKENLQSFNDAYNFGKKLKAPKGLTVFDYINKCWNEEPDKFETNPMHLFARLYIKLA